MSAVAKYDMEEFAPMARTCQITGLSRSTIYKLIREGKFPKPIPVGGRSLWPVSWLHAWVNAQIAAAQAQIPPSAE